MSKMLCPSWNVCGFTGECPHSFYHEKLESCNKEKTNFAFIKHQCPKCEEIKK